MTPYQAVLFAFFKRKHKLNRTQADKCKAEFKRLYHPQDIRTFLHMRQDIVDNDRMVMRIVKGQFTYIEATAYD